MTGPDSSGVRRCPAVELVIFDNDGVVVDSEPIAHAAVVRTLAASGFYCDAPYSMRHFLGRSVASVRQHVEARLGRPLRADFERAFAAECFAGFDAELVEMPGISAVIESFVATGQRFCLASSGTHERIERALRRVGLWDAFAGRIYSAEDVQHGKPAPDLFLHAARAEGVDPENCVVIEDSPAGVQAAHRAGMPVVGFVRETPAEQLADADALVASMDQLSSTLELFFGSSN